MRFQYLTRYADWRGGDLGLTRFLTGDIIRRQAERSKLTRWNGGEDKMQKVHNLPCFMV